MAAPFNSIVCGVEGNPSSAEAARQAIALAAKGAELLFISVYTSFELGPDYHKDTLEESLETAAKLAADAGVSASYEMREARYAIDVLLPESKEHDLLVIGTHGNKRASGILFGSTASEAAHGTERPLLIAREAPGSEPFPERILVATDGTKGSWAAVRAAAHVASAFGSAVDLLHVPDGRGEDTEAQVESERQELSSAIGDEVGVSRPDGNAKKAIVEAAAQNGASLIVAGRRGLKGLKALGSVSERVVSDAGCSVLLVPADAAA